MEGSCLGVHSALQCQSSMQWHAVALLVQMLCHTALRHVGANVVQPRMSHSASVACRRMLLLSGHTVLYTGTE